MGRVAWVSAAEAERPERTARGYHRFRRRDRGKQNNERSGGAAEVSRSGRHRWQHVAPGGAVVPAHSAIEAALSPGLAMAKHMRP